MSASRLARLAFSVGLSAGLVYLVFRSVDPGSLGQAFSQADWRAVPVAIGLYFAGTYLRAARWRLLLPEQDVRTPTLFRALVIGFTANNLLPVRMGEVARAYLLARWCRVPYGATLASLVVERVLDGLTLAVLLLVGVLLVPAPGYLRAGGALAAGGFLGGGALLALAAWRPGAITGLADIVAPRLPGRLGSLVLRLAASFARTLSLVRGGRRLGWLLGLSGLAWCAELSLFLVLMAGLPIPASPALALLVGAAANFATLVPSSPGYVGTFDWALVKVLQDTAGVASAPASAYAIIVHATLLLPVVALGLLLLWRSDVTFGQLARGAEVPTVGADDFPGRTRAAA